MKSKRTGPTHAASPLVEGYTLCHITHDGGLPARFAKDGSRVNCPSCHAIMNYCRGFDEGYRMRYQIISSSDTVVLTELVEEQLKLGWICLGGMTATTHVYSDRDGDIVSSDWFFQTMAHL